MFAEIPIAARILLDLIYRTETGRAPPACYTTIIGHREDHLQKPVTAMTIDELLAAQRTWGKKWKSSAAGAPQIIRATMVTLVKRLGLSGKERFDADMQDRMAFELLKMRGWEKFAAGALSLTAFGNNLAREWASFPVLTAQQGAHGKLKRGQSFYDGDGMNGALIPPAKVEAALQQALKAAQRPAGAPAAPEAPKPVPAPQCAPAPAPAPQQPKKEPLSTSKRFWTWLLTFFGAIGTLADKIGWTDLDWRVQIAILAVIAVVALYGIGSMPRTKQLLGRLFGAAP